MKIPKSPMWRAQTTIDPGSISIRHQSDNFMSDRCLINVDLMVLTVWEAVPYYLQSVPVDRNSLQHIESPCSTPRVHPRCCDMSAYRRVHTDGILYQACTCRLKHRTDNTEREISSLQRNFRHWGIGDFQLLEQRGTNVSLKYDTSISAK